MPRPCRCRIVRNKPRLDLFKPAGIRKCELNEIVLHIDEFEAIRLKDNSGLDQNEAARKMGISQPTFHRLLSVARKKISDALIKGYALRIKGGNFKLD